MCFLGLHEPSFHVKLYCERVLSNLVWIVGKVRALDCSHDPAGIDFPTQYETQFEYFVAGGVAKGTSLNLLHLGMIE